MQSIDNIDYNRRKILIDNLNYNHSLQRLCTEKSFFKNLNCDQYFIKAFVIENNIYTCQGYIYFYIDINNKTSKYIGTYVKPEYRNSGIASLLTASWINFCLENGIYNLTTNKHQRKPFLLYLLKTFSFEIENIKKYDFSRYVIHICQKFDEKTKYLLFNDFTFRTNFEHSKIFKEDNYQIIEQLEPNITKLDSVILSNIYDMKDEELAYQKSIGVIDRHK